MNKRAGTVVLFGLVAILTFAFSFTRPSVQELQADCQRRCAPRMGVWKPDPNFPKAAPGKTVPMTCACQ